MAYKRKQQVPKVSTLTSDFESPPPLPDENSSSSSASSLAAKAIRASSAYKDSSLSSAYGQSALSSPRDSNPLRSSAPVSTAYKDSSLSPTYGQSTLSSPGYSNPLRSSAPVSTAKQYDRKQLPESRRKAEGHKLQKGLDALASSLNYIGGTIGNAFEEGLAVVENRTADIIQETKKLQIRKKDSSSVLQNNASMSGARQQPLMRAHLQPQTQTDLETQLKASRDVAMAMAAKAKLLLRELKTLKADLAFAKERCAQLEEENRILRESREKGGNPEDDDLIRLQLETLLAEKARLGQENSVLTRENRFLREIVEYHQLTMQDLVYLDETSEEVTEVYPIKVVSPQVAKDNSSHHVSSSEPKEVSCDVTSLSSFVQIPAEDDLGRH